MSSSDRYSAVATVLVRVLLLNLAVAIAKIAFGYASGAISILSDGFHSLTDAASNVAGLVGVRAARQPPDEDHPYGHRKYETVAAAVVGVFLLLLVIEVVRNAVNHLSGRTVPHEITAAAIGFRGRVMISDRLIPDAFPAGVSSLITALGAEGKKSIALVAHEPVLSRAAAMLLQIGRFPALRKGEAIRIRLAGGSDQPGAFRWRIDPESGRRRRR